MYICIAPSKEVCNIKGESLGMSGERALYYDKTLNRQRVYRNGYPRPEFKNLKLFQYKRRSNAQKLCDMINEAYNDDFVVREVEE